MFTFTAHFFKNEIYIDNKFAYYNNQFLTELIEFEPYEDLEMLRSELIKNMPKLKLYGGMEDYIIVEYDRHVQRVQNLMRALDEVFNRLSISKHIAGGQDIQSDKLYEVLNSQGWFWDYGDTMKDCDFEQEEDFISEYGFGYADYNKHGERSVHFHLNKFIPFDLRVSIDEHEEAEDLEKLNAKIENLCNEYIIFIDDILRVKNLYTDFVNNYLNADRKFLDSDSLANKFISFIEYTKKKPDRNYYKFTSGNSKFFHTVIKKDMQNILCESYEFGSIGAFLYFDLFRGVYSNYIPKKCENCGKYFLIKSGKYTDYCERKSPQDKTKTCKDVGSRKRYDDKCKTDPVWQAYNRAYKAHYARYMKKKMTVSEFEKWSAWAVEWRTKAENEEVEFEEYVREIKR